MTELKKTVTLGRGVVLAILMVIGSGLLGLPGLVADAGTVQEVVFGWLLIILAAMPLIQICAELGKKFPYSGGLFHYAREAVGEWGGYAVTALVCGSFILGEPAVALIGGEYLQHIFGLSDYGVHLLAFLIITAMTLITVAGVRLVSFFNYAAVVILLFLIAALTFYNFNFFSSGLVFSINALFEGISGITGMVLGISGSDSPVHFPDPYNVWKISALLFWAFLGWENMSFGLGELQNPEKNVKRVFWLSFGLTIFIYLMLAATSIGADADGIPLSGASGLVELVKFTPPGNLLIWLMGVVIIANVTCWNFASSRLVYASGKEEVLPAFLGKISKRGQPMASILSMYIAFVLVLLITCVFDISVSSLLMLVNQNFLFLYGFILLSYWKTETGWRRWVYSGFSFLSISFLVSGFTWKILYSVALTGIGYYGFVRKNAKKKEKEEKAAYTAY
ncbi:MULTISPECIES: APC family permease [Methanosarcina]|jgi:amino acid efflux transporter|uniref:APC family permease n=5 Tax=Methanosarcina mazei TaxID=2209 RepID=A0A0F8J010_METMZ|nr:MULTISPECIES: APC family permease [Methanosarcina]AKB40777.1 Amino acid permease [Methanosarcina mazei WWM610]AKB65068.1 Amino acid permease [Methanosarcina mazei S-6]AKB67881.1 Amino acid permease [Methanosarcina mazei LYC]AKB71136.1 Amino acid permease [Methanosarcina mazei C16]KKG16973.1 putrescine:ornithine antiporter [Methanosarcina mazei]